MKGTKHFKSVIQCYLENRASYDELFAENFRKENKNIDECVTYILSEVQKSGCSGFSDDEIYSMAIHYYDEDNIEVGNVGNCRQSRGGTYGGRESRSTQTSYSAIST